MTNETRSLRVFLCHASEDKAKVREIYQRLQTDGIDVWLDEEKLLPGQEWRHEIPKAVRDSDIILVCLSNKSTTKEGYVQKEITFALDIAEEKPENTIFIIPLRLEECELPGRLRRFQAADYFLESTYQRLLKSFQVRAETVKAKLSPSKIETPSLVEKKPEYKKIAAPAILSSKEGEPMPTGQTPAGIPIYTFAEMSFVKVSAGEFIMGSRYDDKNAFGREVPQHKINVPYDYWIGRFPVTKQQFIEFLNKSHYAFNEKINQYNLDHPITNINWYDAIAFIKWVNRNFRRSLPKNTFFHLANEPEWEKAARGLDGRIFPWGDSFGNAMLGLESCNTEEADYNNTTRVGKFSPSGDSPYGAADMAGNVYEWTRSVAYRPYNKEELEQLNSSQKELETRMEQHNVSLSELPFLSILKPDISEKIFKDLPKKPAQQYFKYPYKNNGLIENLTAKNELMRIVRGGAYKKPLTKARCAYRSAYHPATRYPHVGFRIVITI